VRLNIKPLSVNQAFKGRRFKTDAYKAFEKNMLMVLPMSYKVSANKLSLTLRIGFSNKASDLDNSFKQTIDCLQKKYNFNDSQIYEIHAYKEVVKKGSEYIDFEIEDL